MSDETTALWKRLNMALRDTYLPGGVRIVLNAPNRLVDGRTPNDVRNDPEALGVLVAHYEAAADGNF